jgi:predicted PurR-regulated permease PerM
MKNLFMKIRMGFLTAFIIGIMSGISVMILSARLITRTQQGSENFMTGIFILLIALIIAAGAGISMFIIRSIENEFKNIFKNYENCTLEITSALFELYEMREQAQESAANEKNEMKEKYEKHEKKSRCSTKKECKD